MKYYLVIVQGEKYTDTRTFIFSLESLTNLLKDKTYLFERMIITPV
jgi:hypothetical protein